MTYKKLNERADGSLYNNSFLHHTLIMKENSASKTTSCNEATPEPSKIWIATVHKKRNFIDVKEIIIETEHNAFEGEVAESKFCDATDTHTHTHLVSTADKIIEAQEPRKSGDLGINHGHEKQLALE